MNFHYCWATSPGDSVIYIDSQLNVYRCTYTVGREQYKVGNLSDPNISLGSWYEHNAFQSECWACPIGGYCAGGCFVSSMNDKERQCREEKENVTYFVEKIVIPEINKKISNLKNSYGLSKQQLSN